jgi:hypothetical protein
VGATVTRNGKTYYKGDDGKLYTDYNAARVAAEDRRNAATLQGIEDFFKRDRQSIEDFFKRDRQRGGVGAVFPDPKRPPAAPASAGLPSPTNLNAGMSGKNWPAGVPEPGTAVDPKTWVASVAPGQGAPDPYGDPAARARESEQRRMMQQYASKEYWDTEQGKAMLSLGQQMSAPQDTKLADYYGAQRAVGIGSMDEILSGLASVDDRYKEGGDLRQWAQANQGLALREYNKRFPGGGAGVGEGELAAPSIDTANPTAGEKALMEAKYALHGDPNAVPDAAPAPPSYVPDDRVIGMNPQGQLTVGEGAYGFDPELDQLPIAQPPVQPEAARASNLAPTTETAQQQRADELLQRFKGLTRGQLLSGI